MANFATGVYGRPTLVPRVIELGWSYPSNIVQVVVMRRIDTFCTSVSDSFATKIYEGTATKIYDFLRTGTNQAVTNLSGITDIYDIISGEVAGNVDNFLEGERLYYYTVFTKDGSNNYYYSLGTQVSTKAIKEYYMGERAYNYLPEICRQADTVKELKKFLEIIGFSLDYLYSNTQMITDLLDVNSCTNKELDYIAQMLGWELDYTLDNVSKRGSLKNAVFYYRYAGTRLGLDRLVKLYSGYPNSSGVIESFAFDHYTVDFGTNPSSPAKYTSHIIPNFATGAMDFDLVGTAYDPLHYTVNFSFTDNTLLDDKFFVYVYPDDYGSLSSIQLQQIEARIRKVVDAYKPVGTDYILEIS